jgi:hypothetical protein
MNSISSPFMDQSAVPEVVEAAALGLGAAMMLPGVDRAIFGGAKMAAKGAWGGMKVGAQGVAMGARMLSGVATSAPARLVGRSFTAGIIGGVSNLAIGVGGAALSTGWGVGKGLLGIGKTAGQAAVGPLGSRLGMPLVAGGIMAAGVGMAMFQRGDMGTEPAYTQSASSVSDVMSSMNASGDVVLGLHNRR